jgi:hypothetical protein
VPDPRKASTSSAKILLHHSTAPSRLTTQNRPMLRSAFHRTGFLPAFHFVHCATRLVQGAQPLSTSYTNAIIAGIMTFRLDKQRR